MKNCFDIDYRVETIPIDLSPPGVLRVVQTDDDLWFLGFVPRGTHDSEIKNVAPVMVQKGRGRYFTTKALEEFAKELLLKTTTPTEAPEKRSG